VSARLQLAFDDSSVCDDHALLIDQEVPAAERVAPVVVAEPAGIAGEGGLEQVADRGDLPRS
jgi:hypothetical protein